MGDVGLQPAMHVASVPVGHGTGDGVVGDVAVGDGAVGDGTVGDVVDITGDYYLKSKFKKNLYLGGKT